MIVGRSILLSVFTSIICSAVFNEGHAAPRKSKSTDSILGAKTTQKKIRVQGETSGLSGILGGEFGLLKATPTDSETFGPKQGSTLELKLLTGWLFDDFMIDSGLGFYTIKFEAQKSLLKMEYALTETERFLSPV